MKKLISTLTLLSLVVFGYSQSAIEWAKQIGGTQQDYITDIRYRSVNNTDIFVVVGRFSSSITLSPTITLTTPSTTDTAMFVARFNMSGVCQWGVMAGNANVSTWATSVDIASDGSILVGGVMRGPAINTVDFNPSASAVTNLTCQGGSDIFVAKYTAAGALSWAFDLGGTMDEGVYDIAFDSEAGSTDTDFYITGTFESLLKFDPMGGNNYRLTNIGTQDVFLGKYSLADGSVGWVYNFGAAGLGQTSPSIKVRGDNLVFNLRCSGLVDMNPGTPVTSVRGLAAYNKATGAMKWATTSADSPFEIGNNGAVYKIDWQDLKSIQKFNGANGQGIYDNVVVEKTATTSTPIFRLTGMTMDNTNNIVVSGWYEGDYFNSNPAGVTIDGTKVLPTTVYNQPNERYLFTVILDSNATYQQGGLIGAEYISTNPNTSSARLDYLTMTNMQMKGNTELFVAGLSTVNIGFTWNNTLPGVATTNFATTGTRDGVLMNFNIVPACTNPTITGTSAARCGTGTVTLSASPSAGTVSWYTASSGGVAVAQGLTYTTPSIINTTTYYAQAFNGLCASARVSVVATVNSIPTITATGAARCGAGTVVLNATPSVGTVSWHASSTNPASLGSGTSFTTPSISTTTTYYAQATNNGCPSNRAAATATINAVPNVISVTGATRCGTGTLILGATPSSGSTIGWYTASTGGSALSSGSSFTTPSISATTNYYAQAEANGCVSTSRSVVSANVTQLPTVTGTGASRCGAGTVTISASAVFGTISWYAAVSGGSALASGTSYTTPSLTIPTTYYAEAVFNGCPSTPRTAIQATVNTIPTILTAVDGSRCGPGSVTLTGTASTGATVNWYEAGGATVIGTLNTFNTPVIYNTTNYEAKAVLNGCLSTGTATAVATVYNTSGAVSSIGSTITAAESGATYQWVNCANNANIPGATSRTFTPTASGSYKAIITKNNCPVTSNCTNITVTGLEEEMDANGLRIFPNPFSDNFEIELGENNGVSSIKVYNNVGVLVYETQTENSKLHINTNNWYSGAYIVELHNFNTSIVRKLILKD